MATLHDVTNISIEDIGFIVLPAMGRKYNESEEMIATEARALSGKLRRDFITVKKTFTINYSWLSNSNVEAIIDFANNNFENELMLSVTYNEANNDIGTYTVLLGSVARGDRLLTPPFAGDGAWENVTLTLSEV